jgi:hypothetical protein
MTSAAWFLVFLRTSCNSVRFLRDLMEPSIWVLTMYFEFNGASNLKFGSKIRSSHS